MLKIGLTGGIGSGKTTVVKVFMQLGVPVYISDDRAKYLMHENESLKTSIISVFGEKTFLNGKLNRSYLASTVFSNTNKLYELNALVHPYVKKDFEIWLASQNSNYIIKEAAILFETGANKFLDKVILVESPEKLKIQRIMLRDSLKHEEIIDRMSKQWSDLDKRIYADYIILNDEKSSLIKQILKLHKLFNL